MIRSICYKYRKGCDIAHQSTCATHKISTPANSHPGRLCTFHSCRHSSRATMAATWQTISSDAQAALLNSIPSKWRLSSPIDPSMTDVRSIPRTCGLLTPKQLEITEQTASQLLPQLKEGKLSSVEVTEAFCARAAIAHQCVRCRPSQDPRGEGPTVLKRRAN